MRGTVCRALNERLATAAADLLEAETDEDPCHALNLFEGQEFFPVKELVVAPGHVLRHAVEAAEVASVGDGNAYVAEGSPQGVRRARTVGGRLTNAPKSWGKASCGAIGAWRIPCRSQQCVLRCFRDRRLGGGGRASGAGHLAARAQAGRLQRGALPVQGLSATLVYGGPWGRRGARDWRRRGCVGPLALRRYLADRLFDNCVGLGLRVSASPLAERRTRMLGAAIVIPGIIVLVLVILLVIYLVRRA
jgi:hypothetical protein